MWFRQCQAQLFRLLKDLRRLSPSEDTWRHLVAHRTSGPEAKTHSNRVGCHQLMGGYGGRGCAYRNKQVQQLRKWWPVNINCGVHFLVSAAWKWDLQSANGFQPISLWLKTSLPMTWKWPKIQTQSVQASNIDPSIQMCFWTSQVDVKNHYPYPIVPSSLQTFLNRVYRAFGIRTYHLLQIRLVWQTLVHTRWCSPTLSCFFSHPLPTSIYLP